MWTHVNLTGLMPVCHAVMAVTLSHLVANSMVLLCCTVRCVAPQCYTIDCANLCVTVCAQLCVYLTHGICNQNVLDLAKLSSELIIMRLFCQLDSTQLGRAVSDQTTPGRLHPAQAASLWPLGQTTLSTSTNHNSLRLPLRGGAAITISQTSTINVQDHI